MKDKVSRLPGTETMAPVRQPVLPEELDKLVSGEEPHRVSRECRMQVTSERRLLCTMHEAWVDPLDYIGWFGREWDYFGRRYRDAHLEARRLEERVAELRRLETNAKARVRRVEPEDLKTVRLALTEASRAFARIDEALRALGLGRGDQVYRKLWDAHARCAEAARLLHPDQRARSAS